MKKTTLLTIVLLFNLSLNCQDVTYKFSSRTKNGLKNTGKHSFTIWGKKATLIDDMMPKLYNYPVELENSGYDEDGIYIEIYNPSKEQIIENLEIIKEYGVKAFKLFFDKKGGVCKSLVVMEMTGNQTKLIRYYR